MDNQKKMGAFRRIGLAGLLAASTLGGLSGCIGWAVPVHTPNGTMYYTQSIPVPTNANQDEPIRPIITYPKTATYQEGQVYKGKLIFDLADYDGEFIVKNNRFFPHGRGKVTTREGLCYEGDFRMSERHGQGEQTSGNVVHRGYWHNDKWVNTKEEFEKREREAETLANTKQR
jgi:hypothetical protein